MTKAGRFHIHHTLPSGALLRISAYHSDRGHLTYRVVAYRDNRGPISEDNPGALVDHARITAIGESASLGRAIMRAVPEEDTKRITMRTLVTLAEGVEDIVTTCCSSEPERCPCIRIDPRAEVTALEKRVDTLERQNADLRERLARARTVLLDYVEADHRESVGGAA